MTKEIGKLMTATAELIQRVDSACDECKKWRCLPDVIANVTLALRHLEDAESRLRRAWAKAD